MSGSFGRTVIEERLKTFSECRPNLGTLRELATRLHDAPKESEPASSNGWRCIGILLNRFWEHSLRLNK
jgi:hypothetical protein